jgi:hypothetical protein
MKKLKENLDKDMLVSYIVSTIKKNNRRESINTEDKKSRDDEMEIECDLFDEYDCENIMNGGKEIKEVCYDNINSLNDVMRSNKKDKKINYNEGMKGLLNIINNNNEMYLD